MIKNYKMYKIIILLVLVTLTTISSYAQIRLDEKKTAQFANEVFLNCNQYATAEYLDLYKRDINRIEIYRVEEITTTELNIKSITTLPLKIKCNQNLQHDNAKNFTPENFNPLKYFFPASDIPLYYTITGTNFIIKVNRK